MKKIIFFVIIPLLLSSCLDHLLESDKVANSEEKVDLEKNIKDNEVEKDAILVNKNSLGRFSFASKRLLNSSEFENDKYSMSDLTIMRNEIFARHGHSFKNGGEMDNYFRNQNWYKPKNIDATKLLTEIEKQNIRLIRTAETNKIEHKVLEGKNEKTAIITGTDIIIRNGHSTKSKIIGSFKNSGEKISIISTYNSEKQTILIKNEIIVTDRDGEDNVLQAGKSIKIISVNPEFPSELLISFDNKKGETKEGMIEEGDVEYINESWHEVRRINGETGWVFGKFIKIINK